MKRQPKYHVTIFKMIQIILGLLFVVSGFVKGVDPVGVSYKVTEYLQSFGLEFLKEWSLGLAVLLCAAEIFIGLMLLSGTYRKVSSLLALLFLSVFTVITFYLVVTPSAEIQECGCFGDAFHLSNRDTFLKNILFTFLAALYIRRQWMTNNVPNSSHKRGIYIGLIAYMFVISLFIPFYSVICLPPFDFLPFNIGVNVLENQKLNHADESGEVRLIYKNKQSGESQKFSMDDTTWRDTTVWEYVDTEVPETKRENYLSKFVVMDVEGKDFSSLVFDDRDYTFILIARNVDALRDEDFQKILPLYELYKKRAIHLYLFTSSDLGKAKERLSSHGLSNVEAYNVDEVVLKSMIRNDRGVMLVNGGVIRGKWNLKQESFETITKEKLPALVAGERIVIMKYTVFLTSLVAVLFLCVKMNQKRKRKDGDEKR